MLEYLRVVAEVAGYSEPKSPAAVIGALISIVLSFLGIIFLCLIIYAGFLWMTAGGNENKIFTSKKIIVNGTIGLLIVLSAYAITTFVLQSLLSAIV